MYVSHTIIHIVRLVRDVKRDSVNINSLFQTMAKTVNNIEYFYLTNILFFQKAENPQDLLQKLWKTLLFLNVLVGALVLIIAKRRTIFVARN
jgi:hypothetical protein